MRESVTYRELLEWLGARADRLAGLRLAGIQPAVDGGPGVVLVTDAGPGGTGTTVVWEPGLPLSHVLDQIDQTLRPPG